MDEDRADMLDFCYILFEVLDIEQVDAIVQKITDKYEDDSCPVCHCRSELRDKSTGKRLKYRDDVSNAEWHEMHEIDCAVTYLSELRDRYNKDDHNYEHALEHENDLTPEERAAECKAIHPGEPCEL